MRDSTEQVQKMWLAYIAGFFDGEGSVNISKNKANGNNNYHKIIVSISQRARHRKVLDDICTWFGGAVWIRKQQTRVSKEWSTLAVWQLQSKQDIYEFLLAMKPYVKVKLQQVIIGIEFIETFNTSENNYSRNSLGRYNGKILDLSTIEKREEVRMKLKKANASGPQEGDEMFENAIRVGVV